MGSDHLQRQVRMPADGDKVMVTVVGCRNLEASDWIGELNSYVLLRVDHQLHETEICEGLSPEWEEQFTM